MIPYKVRHSAKLNNKLVHCIWYTVLGRLYWAGLYWRAIFDFPILLVQLYKKLIPYMLSTFTYCILYTTL